jgi:hypothetical protein
MPWGEGRDEIGIRMPEERSINGTTSFWKMKDERR